MPLPVPEDAKWILSGVGVPALLGSLLLLGKAGIGLVTQLRGIGVGGHWSIYIEGSPHPGPHGRMSLRQAGPWVWGRAELSVTESGNAARVLSYKYTGKLTKEQALLRFAEQGRDARLVGATILKIGARGDDMLCMNAFWNHSAGDSSQDARRFQKFRLKRLAAV